MGEACWPAAKRSDVTTEHRLAYRARVDRAPSTTQGEKAAAVRALETTSGHQVVNLPPIYPLPSLTAAWARAAYLEKQIRAADRMLARRHSDAIEAVRVRLEREFDALWLGLEVRAELLRLPKCTACGKVDHPDQASAQRHA